MLSVREARDLVLSKVSPLEPETAPLLLARGQVLSESIIADIDNPPFDNSAVDGYAVRAVDTKGAEAETPVALACIGEVSAGSIADSRLRAGQCMRVMTGAPIPEGADAMVMVED